MKSAFKNMDRMLKIIPMTSLCDNPMSDLVQ